MFAGIALLAVSFAWGQTIVAPQQRPEKTSFAIVTDQVTWEKCRPEIENYRAVLEQEQLPAYILAGQWKNPEQIKELLMRLYRESRLEGAVFIGDIPIPMIRKAQHMTSAFKMDEEKSPRIRLLLCFFIIIWLPIRPRLCAVTYIPEGSNRWKMGLTATSRSGIT